MVDIELLAGSITNAAREINEPRTVDERLRAVVQAAPLTVPGFDAASVSLGHRSNGSSSIGTRAATSELAEELDHIQYEHDQGPCVEAFRKGGMVLVPSLRQEGRWPKYSDRAMRAGVTSQMGVYLGHQGEIHAGLNLYSLTREGIDPEAPGIALLFATHAALALGWARTREQLDQALATRKVIGQGLGIVMERYQITEEKAFAFLIRVSSTGNVKLREVAQELVNQAEVQYK